MIEARPAGCGCGCPTGPPLTLPLPLPSHISLGKICQCTPIQLQPTLAAAPSVSIDVGLPAYPISILAEKEEERDA